MEENTAPIWSLVTVIGPILFALVLGWAIWRNKQRSRAEKDRTERATRDLYEQSDRESKAWDND